MVRLNNYYVWLCIGIFAVMEQIWKDIPGFQGLYRVSNHGEVMLLKRTWETGRKSTTIITRPQRMARKSVRTNMDYYTVTLTKNSKQTQYPIHRLVAEIFIPNPENKRTVNHIDGNKLNNHASNLEWATYSENAKHAFRTNLRNQDGGKNPFAVTIELFNKAVCIGKWGSIREASEATGISKHILYHKSQNIKGRHKKIFV
jgi:hypothetical protein